MIRKVFLLVLVAGFPTVFFAQRSISGTVYDQTNGGTMESVAVKLLAVKDSAYINGTATSPVGIFVLEKVPDGKYIIEVSSVGYVKQYSNVTVEGKNITLRNFRLVEDSKLLDEVVVKGTAAQMVVKGDTLEYNAAAFKTTENAMTEELLKKLPGVEITDGKITVNGEEIKNIRVDGKKFFTGDIEQAIKNLPAEMIEKIQVLDQKSDVAQLTGFEDENTERIINLTTKPNRRQGIFGNAGGGVGADMEIMDRGHKFSLPDDFRYDASTSLNIMNGNAQTRINAGANNINQSRGGRGRGDWGSGSGVTETQNLGLNNNTVFSDRFKFGGDLTLNHSNNTNISSSNKKTYRTNGIEIDTTNNFSTTNLYNANFRLESEWTIDSMNTLIIQPNFGYDNRESHSNRNNLKMSETGDSIRWGESANNGNSHSVSGGLNLIYNHKFAAKKGRSLTVNIGGNFSQSDSKSWNNSTTHLALRDSTSIIDQYTVNSSDNLSWNLRLSWIEPLWSPKNMLEIAASVNSNNTKSQKNQYNKDNGGIYNVLDSAYSNNFENQFYRESIELNYCYNDAKYNIMLGLNAQPSQTRNVREYGNGLERDTTYGVLNFSPTGRFQYYFGSRKTFARFDYRGRTQQPSINQMQPVKNNSDPDNETVGKADLQPSFSHNLRLMYSTFFEKTFASFSTFISANFTQNALVSNHIVDYGRKQYNQTINAKDIPLELNGNVMYSTPIINKLLHINTITNVGYRKQYSYESNIDSTVVVDIDNLMVGAENSTVQRSVRQELSLSFTHDVLDLSVRGNVNYSNSINTLKNDPTNVWNWTVRGDMVLRLPKQFTISSDIAYSDRAGYTNMNQSEIMWNATVQKSLFKNRATLALKANDILRQRLNIRQTVGDNYVSYSRYNTLPAYFLLTFTYQLRSFGGNNNSNGGGNRGNFRQGDFSAPPAGGGRFGGGGGGMMPPM